MKILAINGGKPVFEKKDKTHFPWPIITDSMRNAVLAQLDEDVSIYNRSGIFERFEERFAKLHGKKYALLTSSGTAAIHSMFVGINLKPGDEVICPAYTFYATVTPLLQTGAIPILCDAQKEDGNIDPEEIEKHINSKTKAVIVTHMWGRACRMDEIKKICNKYSLKLLEDCSHAHGGEYQNQMLGSFGDVAAWSLQGQKIITGGEGGIILTDDKEVYYRALLLGHYNKRCKQEIDKNHRYHKYALTGMGLKLRAHPLAIAIADEQMDHLQDWRKQKNRFAKLLINRLSGLPGIRVPELKNGEQPAWYAFIIRFVSEELDNLPIAKFFEALQAEGLADIDMPGSTCPLNLLPLFQSPGELFSNYEGKFSYKNEEFPEARKFFDTAIKLPVWVNDSDLPIVEKYIEAIEKVIKNYQELL